MEAGQIGLMIGDHATNPVDLEIKGKQEVVSTEQAIDAVPLTGIDLLPAIDQIVR